jgi:hypothetical protein
MGATAADVVIMVEAAPHSQITWLPKEMVSRVQAGHYFGV